MKNIIRGLTKTQKKIARELITLGLQRECQSFKDEIEQFIGSSEWETGNPQELYHKLYEIVTTFDKHFGKQIVKTKKHKTKIESILSFAHFQNFKNSL